MIEVPEAGPYRWAFASDEGFKTTVGRNTTDILEAIEPGGVDGRTHEDNAFHNVAFEEPGHCRVRHLWYSGGDKASLEWWLAGPDGDPVALFNDDARGGWKIYRDRIVPDAGSLISVTPEANARNVESGAAIEAVIARADGLDEGSVSMIADGRTVAPSVIRKGSNVIVFFQPDEAAPLTILTGTLNYSLNNGAAHSRSWQYVLEDDDCPDCPRDGGIVSVARDADGNMVIVYQGELHAGDAVDGTWEPVAGASSPHTVPVEAGARFHISR